MKDMKRQRELRAERRKAGLCTLCKTPANGRSLCERCADLRAGYRAESRLKDKPRIVVERITTPFLGRPINAAALRTCPHCGAKPIETIARFGNDRLPSCQRCAVDEEAKGYPVEMCTAARAVLIARTCPGLTSKQIVDELGIPAGEREAATQGLSRAVKQGVLRHNGSTDLEERRFYRTNKPWRPRDASVRRAA